MFLKQIKFYCVGNTKPVQLAKKTFFQKVERRFVPVLKLLLKQVRSGEVARTTGSYQLVPPLMCCGRSPDGCAAESGVKDSSASWTREIEGVVAREIEPLERVASSPGLPPGLQDGGHAFVGRAFAVLLASTFLAEYQLQERQQVRRGSCVVVDS